MERLHEYQFERSFPDCRPLDTHEFLFERGVSAPPEASVRYLYRVAALATPP